MTGIPASTDGTDLLSATATLGGYFAMATQGAYEGAHLAALMGAATLTTFVDRTRSAIAASMACDPSRIPRRLAASSFQLNVVSRLISPVLGAAVSGGAVPLFTPQSVRWLTTEGHSPHFEAVNVECASAPTPIRAAELIVDSLLNTVVGPLNEALKTTASLSDRVSWGNTISAANGAVTVMAMSRPDLEPSGRALVRALLALGPLRDTGVFDGGRFVRHSCCLFYQAPSGGLCGDCVLAVSDGSHQTQVH
ncbi:MAG: hypothetical protein QOJ95_2791 [Mycobacterium sp.]|nr:hypothetical protein [Mycobacterium sp.]